MNADSGPEGWRGLIGRALAGARATDSRAAAEEHGPANWAFALFVFFGAAQLIAAVIMFFAYNWRDLSDTAKIALPQLAMAASFLLWAALPRRSLLGNLAGVAATVMIGLSMAVVGQVYQLGADPWRLFAVWAAFALPLSLIARSDAHLAVWFGIASTAYTLWAEEYLGPRFLAISMIGPASYAVLAFAVQVVRDFVATPVAGPQPNWQRWLFTASALTPATIAALNEAVGSRPFENGLAGTLSLALVGAGTLFLYGVARRDRPARALALFAFAVFVGGAGVRTIWRMRLDGAGEIAVGFLLSALWVVAVTAALAFLLRGRRSPS
ncbi:MAG: DUF2157 domain-containing protein [Parvularculaceae bacterium]